MTNELMMAKKEGYRGLKILSSTIEGAGWGLFATQKYSERDIICSYEGAKLPKDFTEDKAVAGRDYIAMGKKPIGKTGRFETVFIDAWELDSCYGRFINDPIDDHLVNAKIIVKGNKFYVVATEDITPGQEIFISYGKDYWRARQGALSQECKDILNNRQSEKDKPKKLDFDPTVKIVTFKKHNKPADGVKTRGKLKEAPLDLEDERLRKKLAEQHAEDLRRVEAEYLRKYSYDGVIQCPELAEEMQYLVGRKFIDTENNGLYEVSAVLYNPEFEVVVGTRRPMDGRPRRYDDSQFCVFGREGLLELTDVHMENHGSEVCSWPDSSRVMSQKQMEDPELSPIIDACKASQTLKC